MEDELTGNQTATYLSGYGLHSNVYRDEIWEHIEYCALPNALLSCLSEEEREDIEEDLCEKDFTFALLMVLDEMPTNVVWERLKDRENHNRKLAAEASKRRQEFRLTCRQLSKDLLERYLPLLAQRRIERPDWKEEGLKDYLYETLKRLEIKYVVAVKEVGLPGDYSNSVEGDIAKIANEILSNRMEEAEAIYSLGVGLLIA